MSKKRKVETDFEKENYIVSLRRAIDVLGRKIHYVCNREILYYKWV